MNDDRREGRAESVRDAYVKEPGLLDIDKLRADGRYPSEERFAQGPVAVVECAQEVPCNPCETACVRGKLKVGPNIVDMPVLDETCSGCGLCISACPGLAIFVIDKTYGEREATISMPYEFLPLPAGGAVVDACNRVGETVCEGRVVRVQCSGRNDNCPVVTVAVPREHSDEVRHIRLRQEPHESTESAIGDDSHEHTRHA